MERKRKNEEEGKKEGRYISQLILWNRHPKFGGLNKAIAISLVPNSRACSLGWAQMDGPAALTHAPLVSCPSARWLSLGVGAMAVTGHVPSSIWQASSGLFACLHDGLTFQEEEERANWHAQALFKYVLASHLLMSHWAKQVAKLAPIQGVEKKTSFWQELQSHIVYGQAYWDRENLWPVLQSTTERNGLEISFAGKVGRDTAMQRLSRKLSHWIKNDGNKSPSSRLP